jgi:hypothetical protein
MNLGLRGKTALVLGAGAADDPNWNLPALRRGDTLDMC